MGCSVAPTEDERLDRQVQKWQLDPSKRGSQRLARILLVGLPNTGKTTIMKQIDLSEHELPNLYVYKPWIQRVLVFLIEEFESFTAENLSKYGPPCTVHSPWRVHYLLHMYTATTWRAKNLWSLPPIFSTTNSPQSDPNIWKNLIRQKILIFPKHSTQNISSQVFHASNIIFLT